LSQKRENMQWTMSFLFCIFVWKYGTQNNGCIPPSKTHRFYVSSAKLYTSNNWSLSLFHRDFDEIFECRCRWKLFLFFFSSIIVFFSSIVDLAFFFFHHFFFFYCYYFIFSSFLLVLWILLLIILFLSFLLLF
jgi:hypothetical protein